MDGKPEQPEADASYGYGSARFRHIACKRQKNKPQAGNEKTEKKAMLGVEPALRGNRAINTKANHTAGEHRDAGDDVELDAVESLVDINLRRYGNGPADKAGRSKTGRPATAPGAASTRSVQWEAWSELATKSVRAVIGVTEKRNDPATVRRGLAEARNFGAP